MSFLMSSFYHNHGIHHYARTLRAGDMTYMQSWLSLIPPFIVLGLAFGTKRVLPALLVGIVSACLIAAQFDLSTTIKLIVSSAWNQCDVANLYTFMFLLLLGIIIVLVYHAGGSAAYGRLLRGKVKDPKTAETASLLLSLAMFIDDFFSCITVASVMRPITDYFGVPRAKLAFLADAMAAPWVVLMPVSSWVATLTMQLDKAGVSDQLSEKPLVFADSYFMFLTIIPFIFYSYIVITAAYFIIRQGISFGPMAHHETIARTTGNLFGGKTPLAEKRSGHLTKQGTLLDFVGPIGLLVGSVLFWILYTGDFSWLGGQNELIKAIRQTDIFFSLFVGSLQSTVITLAWYLIEGRFTSKELPHLLKEGVQPMLEAILVLFLAWMFSTLLKDYLQTGDYLAHLVVGKIGITALPFVFFAASAIASTATGSSWGTIAVMVPMAIPMIVTLYGYVAPVAPESMPVVYPLLGAIFAGAIAGDHISPIATTTLMSSTSSGCYHTDHVQTQSFYAIAPLASSGLAFMLAGVLAPYGYWLASITSIMVGITSCLGVLYYLGKK